MAPKAHMESAKAGDMLLAIHDFSARSPDELTLTRGDRIELIERDDDFGDGWFLGKHLAYGTTGLFPEVYTTLAPKGTRTNPTERAMSSGRSGSSGTTGTTGTGVQSGASQIAQTPQKSASKTDGAQGPEQTRLGDSTSSFQSADGSSPVAQRSAPSSSNKHAGSTATAPHGSDSITSPVMNETLSVIEEHMTEMNTPRHSSIGRAGRLHDAAHEYNSRIERIDHINGEETDEEENARFTEADIMRWTPEEVAKQMEILGVESKHCQIFREQEISGEVLLSMDQSSIFLKEFDLGPVGRRLKTWHKIRQLQMDVGEAKHIANRSVSDYSMAGVTTSESGRDRSASAAASLAGLPSPADHRENRYSTRSQTISSHPPQPLFQNESETSVGSLRTTRPSAASIRNLNQNRRHSSMDALDSPVKPTTPHNATSPSPTRTAHKQQGSFDRAWTMIAGHKTSASDAGSTIGRPLSQIQPAVSSSEATTPNAFGQDNVTVVSSIDIDKGYFSGNEVDRRSSRNVLRKYSLRDGALSAQHSRTSSFASAFRRRSGSTTNVHATSSEATSDSTTTLSSPPKSYSARFRAPKRSASGPESRPNISSPQLQDYPPTVTKLEYGNSHSIDAVAVSPSMAESEASPGFDKTSPMHPPSAMASIFRKNRTTGLRAISDTPSAINSEKTIVVSPVDMSKESPMHSPVRTGSSTPSGTSKSFEIDDSVMAKTSTTSSGGTFTPLVPPSPAPPRRKTKKATSAYTRGLIKKGPAEQIADCDYSGWMKKKSSNVMATWKPRLFVLKGKRLSYYYSDADTEEKGLIDISNHRVLPANDEKLVGLHATLTGAMASPTSPHNSTTPTTAAADAAKMATNGVAASEAASSSSSMFIFKLVPPREGLSKAVNFTRPTVHYFAVDNLAQGRLWMAALMKATIDKDDSSRVVTTYNQPTISLAKAKAMKHRPPALMADDDSIAGTGSSVHVVEEEPSAGILNDGGNGLGLSLDGAVKGDVDASSIRPSFSESAHGSEKAADGQQQQLDNGNGLATAAATAAMIGPSGTGTAI